MDNERRMRVYGPSHLWTPAQVRRMKKKGMAAGILREREWAMGQEKKRQEMIQVALRSATDLSELGDT